MNYPIRIHCISFIRNSHITINLCVNHNCTFKIFKTSIFLTSQHSLLLLSRMLCYHNKNHHASLLPKLNNLIRVYEDLKDLVEILNFVNYIGP